MKHKDSIHKVPKLTVTAVIFIGLLIISYGYTQDKTPPNLDSSKQTKLSTHKVIFVPYDTPPKPLSPIKPVYPTTAREAGIEGTVIVQCYIDEQGKVTEPTILKGYPDTGLDEASIEAIKKTPFSPATQGDKTVGVWISIPVNFRLK